MYYLEFDPNYLLRILKNNCCVLYYGAQPPNNYFWVCTKLGHSRYISLGFLSYSQIQRER